MKKERESIEEIEERTDQLVEAQAKINEAIELIKSAVYGTDQEAAANAYIIPHLGTWASDDGRSSSYTDCDSLIASIENPGDDDDDDDELIESGLDLEKGGCRS